MNGLQKMSDGQRRFQTDKTLFEQFFFKIHIGLFSEVSLKRDFDTTRLNGVKNFSHVNLEALVFMRAFQFVS